MKTSRLSRATPSRKDVNSVVDFFFAGSNVDGFGTGKLRNILYLTTSTGDCGEIRDLPHNKSRRSSGISHNNKSQSRTATYSSRRRRSYARSSSTQNRNISLSYFKGAMCILSHDISPIGMSQM